MTLALALALTVALTLTLARTLTRCHARRSMTRRVLSARRCPALSLVRGRVRGATLRRHAKPNPTPNQVSGFIFDCDGTIYQPSGLIPGAEVSARARARARVRC